MADLMKDDHLGDRTPSEALQQLRNRLLRADPTQDRENGVLFKELFMKLLPPMIQMTLAAQSNKDLTELAILADNLMKIGAQTAISHVTPRPDTNSELAAEIQRLREEVNSLRHKNTSTERGGLCYYHFTFGSNAKKCQQPCNWTKKSINQGNGQRAL